MLRPIGTRRSGRSPPSAEPTRCGTWPFEPERIAVPVALWYGARDASPTHSPDSGATLAGRIPGACRTVVPGAGGSLLWTHSRAILSAFLDRAAAR
jgi:hypothetical protein